MGFSFVSIVFYLAIGGHGAAFQDTLREVPDKYFVNRECEILTEQASRYASHLLKSVEAACARYRAATISGDQWLLETENLAHEIDFSIPCPMCLRIFLPERMAVPQGFETYTLFLVPSADWVSANARYYEQLQMLKQSFEQFGDAIGQREAAVWFTERYGYGTDVERSKYYCDQLDLNYNDGPYVIHSRVRPDMWASGDDLVVIKLNGISAERVVRVLNLIEQDIRQGVTIRQRRLIFEEIKQKVLSIVEQNHEFVKDVVASALKLG